MNWLHRNRPARARDPLADPPVLLACQNSGSGVFDLICSRLARPVAGRAFPPRERRAAFNVVAATKMLAEYGVNPERMTSDEF